MASRRARTSDTGNEPATILVVEDDEPIRLALRELLESEGYEVVICEDGRDALEALTQLSPALVLTDVQMPHVDGAELCARLRADQSTVDVPIIVLTAARQLGPVVKTADAVVRKPFDIDALLAVIAQFIRPTVPPRPSVLLQTGRHRPTERGRRLTLYVSPSSAACERAERTVRTILENDLHPDVRPQLEVIDVTAVPERASQDGIMMTPTLVRDLDERRELYVGDLSDGKVLRAFLMRLA